MAIAMAALALLPPVNAAGQTYRYLFAAVAYLVGFVAGVCRTT
jgi:hypothetical protein